MEWPRTARASSTGPTIGLFGVFGFGNSGNDASLEVMLHFLRHAQPSAKLICICSSPEAVTARFGVRSVRISPPRANGRLGRQLNRLLLTLPRRMAAWLHAFRHSNDLDMLIIPGTGALDDFGTGPGGIPLELFNWCTAAKLRGASIGFVSVGAGPIHHRLSRWLFKGAAALADYRSYRDTISSQYMESIGFKRSEDRIYPDIVFKLPVPASAQVARRDGPTTVGVGVMAYYGWACDLNRGADIYRRYLEKLARFVRWLLDQGYRVRLLTGDQSDERAVGDLLRKLRASSKQPSGDQIVAEPTTSLHELMVQIGEVDIVVATRFHNIVCALKLAKPTISLGYADKNDVLMADMGLGEFCQHVEKFDVDILKRHFHQLTLQRSKYHRELAAVNEVYKKRLEHQDQLIASTLLRVSNKHLARESVPNGWR